MKAEKKILLVDDDPDFVEGARMVLEKGDFEVVTASSGKECLKRIKEERPDLILLDIMMPQKSGFEVCKELKSNIEYNKIPVVMLTALKSKLSRTSYSIAEGLELEAEDYLEKPIDPKVLVSRLREILEKE
ncbi:response regulator [Candidatus Aerophobetes bacterium]|uniref:Response regulator n=1 Tax=Aerophobetes bacterium TaxID=2030807 RepID=A0A523TAY2_UNCAE|nr:MAG: response regulator [Candidatus Aerophobetes bacterium]